LGVGTEEARFGDIDSKAAQQQGDNYPRNDLRGFIPCLFRMVEFVYTGHRIPPDFAAGPRLYDVRISIPVFAMPSDTCLFGSSAGSGATKYTTQFRPGAKNSRVRHRLNSFSNEVVRHIPDLPCRSGSRCPNRHQCFH
jgi:hypothetical protein